MIDNVILIDDQDQEVGTMEKMEAHRKGLLHRAFSIFVFNSEMKLLLQKRAKSKYHSHSLWTNTCCSHPRPDEDLISAARRRLMEEMGFICELNEIFVFQYKAELDNHLIENEIDHVLVGKYDGNPTPNPDEVSDYAWISLSDLVNLVRDHPQEYTYWLKKSLDRVAAACLSGL
ncbi:MAG: isopentenyl-diphosphate Delta-isomerase [Peptococcaceae bacterium]|nr:isopentenyl-diphosphate Delta-isomerase [Peptococcaceae bacterium]